VHTEFSRFVIFWTGASLCLVYLAVTLVYSGVIRWGESGATTIAYLCIILIFLDLLFLVEYVSVLYEKDDKHKRGDQ
jgi:predicted membrane channel-forming protein YqfA (hemolysin III family)